MTINQMRYFVTLCRERSFSRTAEDLYMTQPAISRQIAALEEELGTQLIVRNRGKALEVTEAGKRYAKIFEHFLNEKSELDFLLNNFEVENRVTYRIGLLHFWYLPEFVIACQKRQRELFPEIELLFDFLPPEALSRQLRERSLDAVILIEKLYDGDPAYITRYIRDVHSVFYVSAKNPAVRDGKIDFSLIEGPFIGWKRMDERHPARYELEETISDKKLVIREMGSMESLKMNVLTSNGISICDEWSEPCRSKDFVWEILPDVSMHVILAYQKTEDPVLLKIMDIVEEQLDMIGKE